MSAKITIEEARKVLHSLDLLEKPYHEGPKGMAHAIQECALPEYLRDKLTEGRMRGREDLHLLRLLRRSETERNCALAYLEHRDAIAETADEPMFRRIRDVIGSEGADTMMFWTFAPYIFKVLKTRGVADYDAIQKILFWTKSGISCAVKMQDRTMQQSSHLFNLPGLEKYNMKLSKGWVLDKDPNHLSHRFTEQEAEDIADILLAKNDAPNY